MFRVLFFLLFSLASVAQAGQQQSLRKLLSADEARDWQAVGRVELAGSGFCTGALIAPNMVLTAAHCMFDPQTGGRIDPDRITFKAGWRQGRAAALGKARRVVVHRDYRHTGKADFNTVGTDIAIIELEHPIRNSTIRPFGRASRPGVGSFVKVVSYARERSETPSLEEPCEILGKSLAVLVLSCNASFGASGSPIFVVENGQPKIASVVSAKATWQDRDVALGTSLGEPLEELLQQLEKSNGVFVARRPGQKSLSEQLGRTSGVEFSSNKP
ncbi:MAG: trypsin-like serine protease [Pseudomonadota bacterium]